MKKIVKENIEEYSLIDKFERIVIGVSGGHDSMALLYVLESLKDEMNFEIVVAHINHGIRAGESDGDEEYVKDICSKLGIDFYSHRTNMDEYAKEHKITSEEAGREIRYNFFRKVAKETKSQKIAVAHNKNDQAETLLMRIMRGTGLDGLRGIEYKNADVIRPLLNIDREIIEKYCDESSISPRIDKTNFMPIYGRNKVRLELIPYIEKTFNNAIINTLFRTSEIMKEDSDYIHDQSKMEFTSSVKLQTDTRVVLDIKKLKNMHISMRSRVIRLAIEKINYSLQGIERKNIKDIIDLIESDKTGKTIDISKNLRAEISYMELILEKSDKGKIRKKENINYKVKIADTSCIQELDAKVKAIVCLKEDLDIDLKNMFVKCFDYDNIKNEVNVRTRKNGDRFIPLGMNGHKKLKDFFIDEKIAKEERDKIPLVLDGENIMWIVGYRISEVYKVTANTKNVLVLEYIK